MNAKFYSLIAALSITAACGGDFERDGADDTADTGGTIDIIPNTDLKTDISERGYGWDSNSGTFYLASWANIYGQSLGMYCDGCRSETGWSDAVAIATYDEDLDAYRVPLVSFGTGVSLRFGFATMNDDGHPDRWIDLSEIASRDPYNFVVEVQECDVRKHNFCVEIASNGGRLVQGECALTYEPPEGCDDDDNDGDTDPDDSDGSGGDDDRDADGDGYTRTEGDCDDGDNDVHPGAAEVCDDEDNDCDGVADEGCDSGSGGGSGGDTTCSIRVSVDGDSSVGGDSTHYVEIYVLPQDSSGNSISTAYWPSGDWSSASYSSLAEALSYSDGGTDTETLTFSGTRISSVKLNGAAWSSSSGGGSFLRWVIGAGYSDTSSASFVVEKSCSGSAFTTMSCSLSGNDYLCN